MHKVEIFRTCDSSQCIKLRFQPSKITLGVKSKHFRQTLMAKVILDVQQRLADNSGEQNLNALLFVRLLFVLFVLRFYGPVNS